MTCFSSYKRIVKQEKDATVRGLPQVAKSQQGDLGTHYVGFRERSHVGAISSLASGLVSRSGDSF